MLNSSFDFSPFTTLLTSLWQTLYSVSSSTSSSVCVCVRELQTTVGIPVECVYSHPQEFQRLFVETARNKNVFVRNVAFLHGFSQVVSW